MAAVEHVVRAAALALAYRPRILKEVVAWEAESAGIDLVAQDLAALQSSPSAASHPALSALIQQLKKCKAQYSSQITASRWKSLSLSLEAACAWARVRTFAACLVNNASAGQVEDGRPRSPWATVWLAQDANSFVLDTLASDDADKTAIPSTRTQSVSDTAIEAAKIPVLEGVTDDPLLDSLLNLPASVPARIFVDFDCTLTDLDTTDMVLCAAADARAGDDADKLNEAAVMARKAFAAYGDSMRANLPAVDKLVADSIAARERGDEALALELFAAALKGQDAFEEAAIDPVLDLGVLCGLTTDALHKAGKWVLKREPDGTTSERDGAGTGMPTRAATALGLRSEPVSLRYGASQLLNCLVANSSSRKTDITILSLCFGGEHFIKSALNQPSIRVIAPRIDVDGTTDDDDDAISRGICHSGRFRGPAEELVHSGAHKLRVVEASLTEEYSTSQLASKRVKQAAMAAETSGPSCRGSRARNPTVFVGDSAGDLRAMLDSAIAILAVRPEMAPKRFSDMICASGVQMRPLLAAGIDAVLAKPLHVEEVDGDIHAASSHPFHVESWSLCQDSTAAAASASAAAVSAKSDIKFDSILIETALLCAGSDAVLHALHADLRRDLPAIPPRVLIVAGSDSGGGAGIQADIKATSALGGFATTAVTALTAQNTAGVQAVHCVPAATVAAQIQSVVDDIGVDCFKTGMLPDADTIAAVAEAVKRAKDSSALDPDPSVGAITSETSHDVGVHGTGAAGVFMREMTCTSASVASKKTERRPYLVVDPVMVSASGHRLIDDAAASCLKESLLPLADICTPNLPETEALLGRRVSSATDDADTTIEAMHVAAGDLAMQTGCKYVLIKGGHAANLLTTAPSASTDAASATPGIIRFAVDVLLHGATGQWWTIRSPVIHTRNTHGTGCTLASAIATGLAKGRSMLSAVLNARRYLAEALHRSRELAIGHGEHGPINHTFSIASWTSSVSGHPQTSSGTSMVETCELRTPERISESLRLYVVTDPGFLAAKKVSLADAVVAAVKGGSTLVQLRDKHADTATFVKEAKGAIAAIRALGETNRVPVLINDRIDVALAVDADGVHVGQSDMPVAMARKLLGPSKIIGTTVSTPEQAKQAIADGADYLGTDPVFATGTKTDSPELGLAGFKAIVEAVRGTPVVAIGGIKLENAATVLQESGAAGIAVVSAVFNQPDMQASAQELRDAVDAAMVATSAPVAVAAAAAEGKEEFFVGDFARSCITAAGSAWSGSFEHPFVLALADGTLSAEKFRFYQMQDARYLESFADACSLISARCHDPEDKLWFIQAGLMALEVERSLHLDYGQRLGYGPADIAATELTPNGKAYADHMVQAATRGSLVEAVAALTPCPWLYIDLGRHLLRERGAVADDHPYAAWLRLYSDSGFLDYMDNLLHRLQKFADESGPSTRARAKQAFVLSARYEYMFWDQAWHEQTWPCT